MKTKSYKVKYKSDDKLDERRQNLLDKRAQLTGEVTAALKDISHLENDLGRLEQEILDTGQYTQFFYSVLKIRMMLTFSKELKVLIGKLYMSHLWKTSSLYIICLLKLTISKYGLMQNMHGFFHLY